jgi:hypothetical protein
MHKRFVVSIKLFNVKNIAYLIHKIFIAINIVEEIQSMFKGQYFYNVFVWLINLSLHIFILLKRGVLYLILLLEDNLANCRE